jgi:hypothetical protein
MRCPYSLQVPDSPRTRLWLRRGRTGAIEASLAPAGGGWSSRSSARPMDDGVSPSTTSRLIRSSTLEARTRAWEWRTASPRGVTPRAPCHRPGGTRPERRRGPAGHALARHRRGGGPLRRAVCRWAGSPFYCIWRKPASVAYRLRVVRIASFIEEGRVPSVLKAFNSTMQVAGRVALPDARRASRRGVP